MLFSSQTIDHVQTTWTEVEQIAPAAAALFYENLFTADPSLRPLFRGDMTAQGEKLMQMIGAAVQKLTKPEALVHVLQALGRRHGDYGVEPSHYDTVGAALLQTLAQGLGEAFTPAVEQAWAEVYGVMAHTMIAAAETAEAVEPVVAARYVAAQP